MLTLLIALFAPVSAFAEPPATPPAEAAPEAPRTIEKADDVHGAKGARATVTGTLKRVSHEGTEGTAIVLADGTNVFVSQGAPPEGWDWMVGTKIRVQGALWAEGTGKGGAWSVATLTELDTPMPADVGMPGMGL
jgi:hypothetical protein